MASSIIATVSTTTSSGTTSNCYEIYTVQGDYCGKVEDLYRISMA